MTATGRAIGQLTLEGEDRRAIDEFLRDMGTDYAAPDCEVFLRDAKSVREQLPASMVHAVEDFAGSREGGLVVHGFDIDDRKIGDTPDHWQSAYQIRHVVQREEFYLVALGSLFGDVSGWSTQQDGHLIHDVLPIRGHEREQLGSNSAVALTCHTEDAFHPQRPDYVALLCLRNPQGAATTLAHVDDMVASVEAVDPDAVGVLFDSRFGIVPDNSHLPRNNSVATSDFDNIEALSDPRNTLPILFGDSARPRLRFDPDYTHIPEDDLEAKRSVELLIKAVEEVAVDVVLEPGDCLVLDNHSVVHGRRPFRASYDGSDRWLKRVLAWKRSAD